MIVNYFLVSAFKSLSQIISCLTLITSPFFRFIFRVSRFLNLFNIKQLSKMWHHPIPTNEGLEISYSPRKEKNTWIIIFHILTAYNVSESAIQSKCWKEIRLPATKTTASSFIKSRVISTITERKKSVILTSKPLTRITKPFKTALSLE